MKFHVKVQATAEIEEVWLVEAANAEAAEEVFWDSKLHEHECVSDRVIGEEQDRSLVSVEPVEYDPRTGRMIGDHGTAQQAIDFALDALKVDIGLFLRAWRDGDLDVWPDYYQWLAQQETKP